MSDERDDRALEEALWDPSAPADADVLDIEARLAPLRFDPLAAPLKIPAALPRRSSRLSRWIALPAAAALLAAAGAGFWQWRLSWPAGQPWSIASAPASAPRHLEVGVPLSLPASEGAVVNVARIGSLQIDGGTKISLRSTAGNRHRLTMERGAAHLRVWSRPGSVSIHTPTGEVIDLGCEFELTVDSQSTQVRVLSGWVQLANAIDESLVPAGASSEMRADRRPGVPIFDDASPILKAAVRELERSGEPASVEAIVQTARARDVLTLLLLIEERVPGAQQLAVQAAALWPPPSGVTVGRVVGGDRDALWKWRDSLALPSPKGWLRNWRDGLPGWLVSRR